MSDKETLSDKWENITEHDQKPGTVWFKKLSKLGSDGSILGNEWIADGDVKNCPLCKEEFGFFTRRHHCRLCGQVICDNCSKTNQPCPEMYYGTQRMCKPCCTHLQEFRNEQNLHKSSLKRAERGITSAHPKDAAVDISKHPHYFNVLYAHKAHRIFDNEGHIREEIKIKLSTNSVFWNLKKDEAVSVYYQYSQLYSDTDTKLPTILDYEHILSCDATGRTDVTVHAFPIIEISDSGEIIRRQSSIRFRFLDEVEQLSFLTAIRCCLLGAYDIESALNTMKESFNAGNQKLAPLKSLPAHPVPKTMIVFINPFGGTKIAPTIWKSVKHIFDMAGIKTKVIETERAGHAKEEVLKMDVSNIDGIVCCSGDGVIWEVVQGLMGRTDDAVHLVPVGLIAGGSGNGLASTIHATDAITAAFGIAKGNSVPLDLIEVKQSGVDPFYSFLSVNWGMISDVDFERFMGAARFTVGAIVRMLDLRLYKARLEYVPIAKEKAPMGRGICEPRGGGVHFTEEETCQKHNRCQYCLRGMQIKSSNSTTNIQKSEEWVTIEGDFVFVLACNVTDIGKDFRAAPYAHLSDGCIDLVYALECPRGDLAQLFLEFETGNYVITPLFQLSKKFGYVKTRKFRLTPLTDKGSFGIDGERVPKYLPIECTNLLGAIRIFL